MRQTPERRQDVAIRARRLALKDHIARLNVRRHAAFPDALRLEQPIQDVIFIDEGQVEGWRQSGSSVVFPLAGNPEITTKGLPIPEVGRTLNAERNLNTN